MLITVAYLSLLLNSGLAVEVHQSADQIRPPDVQVDFECSMGQGFSMSSFTMLWYRQKHFGAPLEFLIKEYDKPVGRFQSSIDGPKNSFTLQISELHLNDSSTYYCAARDRANYEPAYFGSGTKLTVLETDAKITEPTVKVLPPSRRETQNKTLVCVASDFYPDHVNVFWKINETNVIKGVATDNAAWQEKNGTYTITSRLRVSAIDWHNPDTLFTCTVDFFNGNQSIRVTDLIFGKERGTISRGKYLKITQNAKLSYSVLIAKSCIYGAFVAFLVWKIQGSAGKQNH